MNDIREYDDYDLYWILDSSPCDIIHQIWDTNCFRYENPYLRKSFMNYDE